AVRAALVRGHPQEERYQAALAEDHLNLGTLYASTGRRPEANGAYEQAEALLRPLVDRHPPGGQYALSLAGTYMNWANILKDTGRPSDALSRATSAVELAEAVFGQEPHYDSARRRANNAHGVRAQVFEALGRWADAVEDWDRVVELDPGPQRWMRRVPRA